MSTSLKLRMISLRSNPNFVQDTSRLESRFASQCVMQSFENPDSAHDSRLCFFRLRLTCSFSLEFSFLRRSGSVVCAPSQKDTLITNAYEPILMHPKGGAERFVEKFRNERGHRSILWIVFHPLANTVLIHDSASAGTR